MNSLMLLSAAVGALPLIMVGCASAAGPTATATAPQPIGVSPTPEVEPFDISLRWFGHSTFLMTTAQGTRVLMDPMSEMGYALPSLRDINAVTVSHEHFDHNNVALAGKGATVIRGLAGKEWAQVHQQVGEVSIRTVPTYHDTEQGRRRGKNSIFVFEVKGLRIAHLGDLGHVLTQEQAAAVGPVDVVLIPVGGYFTIDAATASKVVEQLSPKLVIPMHYKTAKLGADWPIASVEGFLVGKQVQRVKGNVVEIRRDALPSRTTVIVLNYE